MIVTLLSQLIFIKCSEFFDTLVVFDIVLFEFDSHFTLFPSESVELVFVLFSSFSKSASQIVNFVFSLLKFITESFEFGFV